MMVPLYAIPLIAFVVTIIGYLYRLAAIVAKLEQAVERLVRVEKSLESQADTQAAFEKRVTKLELQVESILRGE